MRHTIMRKYINQKGQDLIEYALLLAIVVGIGSFITTGFGGSISSIFGNSSNLLGTVASNAQGSSSKLSGDDRNMKWLKDKFLGYTNENWFHDQVDVAFGPRHKLDFSLSYENAVGGGLTDSEAGSDFMGNFDCSDLGDCSWVMSEYTEGGQKYYGISIYDPAKNGNKKLSQQAPGTEGVITDVYHVDPSTGTITKLGSNMKQNVKQKTDKNGYTYNVIRGNPQP